MIMTTVNHDATQHDAAYILSSNVMGEVLMPPEALMRFPTPLFGLPDQREYALLPAARAGLWWLQSMTDPGLTFLLADPFVIDESFGVDLGDAERAALHIETPLDAFALVMVTLPDGENDSATANFRAPLVFNLAEQVGMQVVARDEGYSLRRPIEIALFPPQTDGLRMQ